MILKKANAPKIIAIVLVIGILLVGGGFLVYKSSTSNSKNASDLYPKNSNGQSFGSAMNAETDDMLPDLIRVEGKYGNVGYIYKDDYLLTTINDYERYSEALSKEELQIVRESYKNEYEDVSKLEFYNVCYDVPVYDETGDNVIDKYTFIMGTYPY